MIINFCKSKCQTNSSKRTFGLCDDPAPAKNPAYIDELNGANWIAVVENESQKQVTFTAIDNCIDIFRSDGKMKQRCDGMLTYNSTVIFVELKDRDAQGNAWVEDAIPQLKSTIESFEDTEIADNFKKKLAYISNKQHPIFKSTQQRRMDAFYDDTSYILRIQGRINLQ
ncbi:MAG: hypothetical protein A2W91_06600 [Bacteroidetes bacterium GWF2_38_335]|nr:MAG: hypothetical protein A2W91_06600 [Bacteroidetes bacterium GWF2_38_335]OFY77700.1 MAG: hypothetical protein A2281_18115 [Bacteroidetes bacterium RIFOXYA12_FULL_38_20]HBS89069.1 hypothetical protein [Bacteroidales bacterium]